MNGNIIVPIVFIDTIFPDEEFRALTVVDGYQLKDYYMISNYGRIYSKYANKFLSKELGTDNHWIIPLAIVGGHRNFRVARLVMCTFNYFPGCENYIVNHKDGIPYSEFADRITNLEWSTVSNNTKHAYATGLRTPLIGSQCKSSKIDEQKAEEICALIAKGINLQLIAEMCDVSKDTVYAISSHRSWNHISAKYEFPVRKIKRK